MATGAIQAIALFPEWDPVVSGGSGYAAGDTGTVNGGDGTATYRIASVGGAGHYALVFTVGENSSEYGGTGYSVASGVGTTPGGAQPGGGSGLTIDITAIREVVDGGIGYGNRFF